MLARVAIPVPLSGASAWFPSTLTLITSWGLIGPLDHPDAVAPDDSVILCGSHVNTDPVIADLQLSTSTGYAGPMNQLLAGITGKALGAWSYYAVIRNGGTSPGLGFILTGNG